MPTMAGSLWRCRDLPCAAVRAGCAAVVTGLLALSAAACGDPSVDNGAVASAIAARSPAEVTLRGPVRTVLTDSFGADGRHQRFTVDLGGGVVVEIDHNLSLAPRVPVTAGTTVTVHGQFEPDPGHPVIHFTHHATGRHEGGWIDLSGTRYQ